MPQAGCILLVLVVAAALLAPVVGGWATGFVVALVLMVVIVVAGYFYLKGDTKRQVQGVLARIDACNPQWHFDSTQSSYGGNVRFSWRASALVVTEDRSLSAELTESVETLAGGTHREAHVQVRLENKILFNENFRDIADNEYAIAFISSRIAAVAGEPVTDPLTRCRSYLAAEAGKQRRESEIRRKYTGI
jgi:hypothetical protein